MLWANCYESKMDKLIFQHMAWHPLSWVPHQGQICSSLHNEGHVSGYLCQLCAHGGISFNGIERIRWKIIHHGEGMTWHEDMEMTCIIIIRSMIFITIKPCICNGSLRSILPSKEDVDI